MKEFDKNLNRANNWLNGKTFVQYDINGAAQALRDLSDTFKDDQRDDRDIIRDYENQAEAMGLSFGNMTKDQQLAIINATGREGFCYNSFISNSSHQVLTLARAGSEDVETIADGFTGKDLTKIATFVRVFGDDRTEDFYGKLNEIKDRVIQSEQAQENGVVEDLNSSTGLLDNNVQ